MLGKLDVDNDGGLITSSNQDQAVWNDLLTTFGKTPIPDGQGKGGLKFEIDNFIFNWYPVSHSYSRPTIKVSYDNPALNRKGIIIKIRF